MKRQAERDAQGYLATYSLALQQQEQEAEEIVAENPKTRLELLLKIKEKLKEYSKPEVSLECESRDIDLTSV